MHNVFRVTGSLVLVGAFCFLALNACGRRLTSAELRDATINTTLEWSGISDLPISNEHVTAFHRNDAAFTGDYAIEFTATPAVIAAWISSRVKTLDGMTQHVRDEGSASYVVPPQKGALHAEVIVSASGDHVRIVVVWS